MVAVARGSMVICARVQTCGRYHSINLVACVVSALFRCHEASMLRFVDAAIERARCTVDRNDHREGQRRVCLMRAPHDLTSIRHPESMMAFLSWWPSCAAFERCVSASPAGLLGELYNYKLLDSSMVFGTLFTLLPRASGTWGRVVPFAHVPAHADLREDERASARALVHPKESMVDGPEDYARVRCVCALLDTCGQYFTKGSGKRRLDIFLVYLNRCNHNRAIATLRSPRTRANAWSHVLATCTTPRPLELLMNLYVGRYTFCKVISPDVEFMLSDTLAALRPRMMRPQSCAHAGES